MSLDAAKNAYTVGKSYGEIDNDILNPVEGFPEKRWWTWFTISLTGLLVYLGVIGYSFVKGLGIFGINSPVNWGVYIIGLVFWLEIGHAGTMISAILYLFRQRWRTSINRAAEAMTIFAVTTAALLPLIHLGRPWMVNWLFPYPNDRGPLWNNFNSPLLWDVYAISTYFTVSLFFWYMGLLPDFAAMRDRAVLGRNQLKAKTAIGEKLLDMRVWLLKVAALGWVGSGKAWHHYEKMVMLLAALATPLVMSVQSILSFDFVTSVVPGWHSTILPINFITGSIYSGFAMVLSLVIIMRSAFNMKAYITDRHIDNLGWVMLFTGMLVFFGYFIELFMAYYSANDFEQYVWTYRFVGDYAWAFWLTMVTILLPPHIMWFKKLRNNHTLLFIMTVIINIGMWFERFVITVTPVARDFLPSSWRLYVPTVWDVIVVLGEFAMFFTFFLLFVRVLPSIAFTEVKMDEAGDLAKGKGHH